MVKVLTWPESQPYYLLPAEKHYRDKAFEGWISGISLIWELEDLQVPGLTGSWSFSFKNLTRHWPKCHWNIQTENWHGIWHGWDQEKSARSCKFLTSLQILFGEIVFGNGTGAMSMFIGRAVSDLLEDGHKAGRKKNQGSWLLFHFSSMQLEILTYRYIAVEYAATGHSFASAGKG